MQRGIAMQLNATDVVAVAVSISSSRPVVDYSGRIAVGDSSDSLREAARQLRHHLSHAGAGKASVTAVLPRDAVAWHTYDLPPCPDEELPDLVIMQAQRDIVIAEDGIGFDFLPLAGDAEHPRRVLAIGARPEYLKRLHAFIDAADLRLDHATVESFGWPAIVGPADGGEGDGDASLALQVGLAPGHAALFAVRAGEIVLMRTVMLPVGEEGGAGESDAVATVLAGELRRSRLALADLASEVAAGMECHISGVDATKVAAKLGDSLGFQVSGCESSAQIQVGPDVDVSESKQAELLPMAGLASLAARSQGPAVDLLNPRRPPAPPNKTRTYVLAGAAAAVVVAALGWKAYSALQLPLKAAQAANSELASMKVDLDLAEQRIAEADEIQAWIDSSSNVLAELDSTSAGLRPQPTSAEDFPLQQDVLTTKFDTAGRGTTLSVAVRNADAINAAETRLRDEGYLVDRDQLKLNANLTQNYPHEVKFILSKRPTAGNAQP